jgi:hypothetical protein
MNLGPDAHISFKLPELRYLNNILPLIQNQLATYYGAMRDVMTYAISALASSDYTEPQTTLNKNILYPHLFEELKNILL